MSDRRVGQHTMTEIENERSIGQSRQDHVNRPVQRFTADEKRQWVEIALNGAARLNIAAREVEANGPVQSHGIDGHFFKITTQIRAGASREPNDSRLRDNASHLVDNAGNRPNAPSVKLGRRQNSCPSIENLHGIDASRKLAAQIFYFITTAIPSTPDFAA